MKRINHLLLALAAMLITTAALAQDKNEEKAAAKHPMNIVKLNLTGLILKNYGFQYERVLNRKFSVALGFRTMPNGLLPLQSTLTDAIGNNPDAQEQVKNFNLGNTAITPEFRFYLSRKGYGRGFYLAPFYRNVTFKGSGLKFTYQNSLLTNNTMSMSGKLTGNTVGLLIGSQFSLGKYIALDLWIIGPHYGSATGDFSGTSAQPLSQTEQDNLRKEIEDFDIPLTNKTITVNSAGANVKLSGPFAGIRSGITIGVRF
ncbi:MAG: hypothetical protein U0V75_08115 [Ferruginibacter sp.]